MNRYEVKRVALACALALSGCGSSGASVGADVVVVDRRLQALTASQIDFVDGTYTGCTGRTGSWSLRVAGSPTLTHAPISILQGDSFADCRLAITDIHTTGDGLLAANGSPIGLDVTFGPARSFGTPTVLFYANAVLGDADFDDPVAITLLFSDDPSLATASNVASYAVTTASVSPTNVSAPDYVLSLAGVSVTTDLQKKVVTVSGDAVLMAGSSPGESYAVILGPVGSTYADIKAAYDGASQSALALMIPASSVLSVNDDLTGGLVRTLIVAHAQSGVMSFQKFAITFNPPP